MHDFTIAEFERVDKISSVEDVKKIMQRNLIAYDTLWDKVDRLIQLHETLIEVDEKCHEKARELISALR